MFKVCRPRLSPSTVLICYCSLCHNPRLTVSQEPYWCNVGKNPLDRSKVRRGREGVYRFGSGRYFFSFELSSSVNGD